MGRLATRLQRIETRLTPRQRFRAWMVRCLATFSPELIELIYFHHEEDDARREIQAAAEAYERRTGDYRPEGWCDQ